MARIRFLLILSLLTAAACSSPESVQPAATPTDSLVLAGAKLEIANGTKYNPWLLWNYVTTDYLNGKRQAQGVYPNGDIDPREGVCSDLVVRSFRHAGIDLQQAVHEDITAHPESYGINSPDKFIDHRRVWVLLRYFKRNFKPLTTGTEESYSEWLPGDVVIWDIGSNEHFHIGIISDRLTSRDKRPYVVHAMAYFPGVFSGRTAEQDVLLGPHVAGAPVGTWKVIGHFRLSCPKGAHRVDQSGPPGDSIPSEEPDGVGGQTR